MEKKTESSQWFKLQIGFFAHPKCRFMLKKHGAAGPLCVLAIWAQMIEHGGEFDASKEFNITGLADSCDITQVEVGLILGSAQECGLINLSSTQVEPGLYTKQRIIETIESIEKVVKRAKKGGESTQAKRRLNAGSTDRQIDKIDTEPIGSAIAIGNRTTTHAPLWGRLVEKFHVTKIQTPEIVAEIEKNIRLIPPVRLYELFGKKDSPGKYHPDDITFRLNSDPLSLMTDNSAENIAARTFQPTNA